MSGTERCKSGAPVRAASVPARRANVQRAWRVPAPRRLPCARVQARSANNTGNLTATRRPRVTVSAHWSDAHNLLQAEGTPGVL